MNHSVKELCSVYEVSRSGYYKWKNRKGALNRYDIRHMKIDYLVDDIHSKHPSQGYRSIADTIFNEHNLRFSDYSVMKSMQRLNIKGFVRKQKNSSPEGEEHKKFPNILNRNFNADKPMKKIVTDVTYIKYKNRWYYLACFLDLYNNEIIDWELSDKFDNFLVMKPAGRILEKTKSTESQILFHSDQGVQYSSAGYCNLLKSYNVIQSMSRAGNPRDNAVIESFFGRFKDVLFCDFQYWKSLSLESVIADAVYYFNYQRPVRKLNGKPPVIFRNELVA